MFGSVIDVADVRVARLPRPRHAAHALDDHHLGVIRAVVVDDEQQRDL